jgi:hypothetical protein
MNVGKSTEAHEIDNHAQGENIGFGCEVVKGAICRLSQSFRREVGYGTRCSGGSSVVASKLNLAKV